MEVNEKRMKELKGKKFKLNLKRCGIFLRYTLPTVLYIFGAGLGFCKTHSLDTKYDHAITEYSLGNETPELLDSFHSTLSEPKNVVRVETTWNKHEWTDEYYKMIYTFDISKIDQEKLLAAFQANDEAYVQNVLSILPEPEVDFINESDPQNVGEGMKVSFIHDDITKSTNPDMNFADGLLIVIAMLAIYLTKIAVCLSICSDEKHVLTEKFRKHQFPFSLIDGLKEVNTEIKEVKNEESQLRLTMKR